MLPAYAVRQSRFMNPLSQVGARRHGFDVLIQEGVSLPCIM